MDGDSTSTRGAASRDRAAAAASPEGQRAGTLGFVAHEVRNPLATALWTAELLARMSAEDRAGPRGDKMTAMMLRALGRVRQTIEDHFLCERLDVAGLPVHLEALGAAEAVGAAAARRAPDLGPVTVDVDGEARVLADRGLLERALDALVAAAGAEGTAVRVGARGVDGNLQLRFEGVPAAEALLVDPDKSSPAHPKGRALGLPAARRVAAALGGGLAVQGGAWVLTLPRASAYTDAPDPAP
jgi:signal transduction histidine kinase